jgi:two-component system chemotaxis response regulator CheB
MQRNLVVIGASAGGIEALRQLTRDLPANLAAAVLLVVHVPPHVRSMLPEILARSSKLPVRHAVDGERVASGAVLVAPPDRHLLVDRDFVRLTCGPREHGTRPAVDPLFRTAARWGGRRVIGVILSGSLDDGTAGLLAVKMRGGLTFAQDPDDAAYPSMPRSAIDHVDVDRVLRITDMACAIAEAVGRPAAEYEVEDRPMPEDPPLPEEESLESAPVEDSREDRDGAPSGFTCPDCHGALWEVVDGKVTKFRCRVGHAYAPQSLVAMQAEGVEEAMWAAYRALEESANMSRRMSGQLRERGLTEAASRYDAAVDATLARATLVRRALGMAANTNANVEKEPAPRE